MSIKTLSNFFGIFLFMLISGAATAQEMWDWHISGGSVVDGSGKEAFRADILIRSDTIGFIGKVDVDTVRVRQTIDASGKIVSPGFIDVHAHGNPDQTPEFRNFLAMGVTTIVLGQDGSSSNVGSLDDWFSKVTEAKPAVNVAALSGHGSIRSKAEVGKMPANEQELRRMEKLLEADLKAGAFGLSTGLEYVSGMYADEVELMRMAKVAGRHDGIVMSHMRSEDDSEIETSLNELVEQGRYARVHASHLKVVYGKGADRAEEILELIQRFRERDVTFTADVYPYTASYTGIGIVFPDWAKTAGEWKQAMKERPEFLRRHLRDKVKQRNGPDAILFGSGPYSGQTLKEAAEQAEKSPIDLLLDMGPKAASAAHFVMDEELQDRLVQGNKVMVSSDGSPTMRHPRGYGSFAKIIRKYVNEQQSLTLEKSIYKMSGLPAETLKLADRGILKTGNKADILIFDPEKVRDRATFENPHQLALGFDWVLVNGQPARENGEFNAYRFGVVVKKK